MENVSVRERRKQGDHNQRPRVVIVGAGFAGLKAAHELRKAPVQVVMIDRNNYHKFQPLLYQVATAGLDIGNIAKAVRSVFHGQDNFNFLLGTVRGVDWERRQVVMENEDPVEYDYLVLAAGASTNFFGVEGVEEHSFPLKNMADAVIMRNHILTQFERANLHPELIDKGILNFVIVGGGPTGLEMAGALIELFDHVLVQDYPKMEVERAEVIMVEMAPHLLAAYDEPLREYAQEMLDKRGVKVRFNETVVRAEADKVHLKSGETIPTETLIWAAGVKANPLADTLGLDQKRSGQVLVNEDMSVPGHPEAYIVGDMAFSEDEEGIPYPQLAPVAIAEAKHAAQQIERHVAGDQTRTRFTYQDLGQMATIGRNAAVAELPGLNLRGFTAWLIWVFLHIVKLIGFRNKVSVFSSWVYNYLTYDRSARLIIGVEAFQEAKTAVQEKFSQYRKGDNF